MSRQVLEIEVLLNALIGEHQRLLRLIDAQQQAMRALDLPAMERARQQQDACRLRIATLETRRRPLAAAIGRAAGLVQEPTLSRIAQLHPQRAGDLLALRDRLKDAATQVAQRVHVVSKLAAAVLGHLNTAARLLAGAVEQAGVYTKTGMPRAAGRIGTIEAIG